MLREQQTSKSAQKQTNHILQRKRNPVDGTLMAVVIMLLLAGLLVLFSATYYTAQATGDPLAEVKKQLIGIALGAAAMLVTSRIPYRFWRDTWVVIVGLALSAVLLILLLGNLRGKL